jgi:hypothetical protein
MPNAAWTVIPSWVETFDTDNMHDMVTNPSRITIRTPGKYFVYATIGFNPGAGIRGSFLSKNGIASGTAGSYGSSEVSAAITAATSLSDVLDLVAGDYLEVQGYQNSGATAAIVGNFTLFIAHYLGYTEAFKVRKTIQKATVRVPKVGDTVLVARELGTRRLPRCLGILQGKNWISAEDS